VKQQAGKDVMMRMWSVNAWHGGFARQKGGDGRRAEQSRAEQSRAGSFCRLSRNLPKTGGGMHACMGDGRIRW
jgi:hypothetical protein